MKIAVFAIRYYFCFSNFFNRYLPFTGLLQATKRQIFATFLSLRNYGYFFKQKILEKQIFSSLGHYWETFFYSRNFSIEIIEKCKQDIYFCV